MDAGNPKPAMWMGVGPSQATREIEDRERRRFRPFIWIVTEDGALSFLTAIAERQLKVLRLAEGFEHLSDPARLETVRRRVRERYQKTGGKYIGFRQILRYRYAPDFDHSIVLDTDGSVIEQNGGRFLLGEVWMNKNGGVCGLTSARPSPPSASAKL